MRSWLGFSVGAALFVGASAAAAQDFTPQKAGHRIGLDLDVWPTADNTIVAMALDAQIAVHPLFALDFNIPWAFGGDRSATYAAFGNPTFGGHFVLKFSRSAAFFAGGTFSIPVHPNVSNPDTAFTLAYANAARAFYDGHRFVPEHLFVRLPVGIEVHFAKYFYYRGDLTPVIRVPVSDRLTGVFGHGAQLVVEHSDEFEARSRKGVGGGLRLQFAFALTDGLRFDGRTDQAQAALEPFFSYEAPEAGLFVHLGVLVALDSPAGFGFDRDKVATLRARIGGKF